MDKHNNSSKLKTIELVYISVFAALIAICSWISIPATVPFTLQTFAIFLAVGLLGGKLGSIAVLIYILLGAIGLPVFSGFRGGLGVLFGNTGGYILGFLLSALFMWLMEKLIEKKTWSLALSMVLGLIICYAFGTVWFMYLYMHNTGYVEFSTVLGWCVIPFIIPDIIKIMLALFMSKTLHKVVKIND